MSRALIAEALGCGLLAFAALGAAQAAQAAGLPVTPTVAAAAGLMLFVTITILAPVSGGHLNPAITLLFVARRAVSPARAASYIAAQIVGALIGGALVATMAGTTAAPLPTMLSPGWGLSEALATAGFVIIVAGALAHSAPLAPAMAGAYGAVMVLCTVSGGMANPAVMAARALTLGPGGLPPSVAGSLVAWQLGGAVLALGPALWLFQAPRTA